MYPNFWTGCGYPIIYYFIGCYLNEYKLKISKLKNIILIIGNMLLFSIFVFFYSFGKTFEAGIYTEYFAVSTFITAFLIANLVLNSIEFKAKTPKFKKIIGKISYLTFGAYLLSAIFDSYIVNFFYFQISCIKDKLILWIPLVIVTITCSLIASYFIDLIQRLINYSYNKVKKIIVKT